MISPLNVSRFEAGLEAYIEAELTAANVQVPAPDGQDNSTLAAPAVITGVSLEAVTVNAPSVAVVVNEAIPEAPGCYGDRLRVQVAAVSPLLVQEITLEAHRALFDALLACFPNRPRANAPAQDVTDWNAKEAALSGHVQAATGYTVQGWFTEAGRQSKAKDRVEQVLVVRPGLLHADLI